MFNLKRLLEFDTFYNNLSNRTIISKASKVILSYSTTSEVDTFYNNPSNRTTILRTQKFIGTNSIEEVWTHSKHSYLIFSLIGSSSFSRKSQKISLFPFFYLCIVQIKLIIFLVLFHGFHGGVGELQYFFVGFWISFRGCVKQILRKSLRRELKYHQTHLILLTFPETPSYPIHPFLDIP